jgi:hypothetical protein
MQLMINEEEHKLISELVDSRIQELHPTIRRSRLYQVHDDLKHDLQVLENLQRRLKQADQAATV